MDKKPEKWPFFRSRRAQNPVFGSIFRKSARFLLIWVLLAWAVGVAGSSAAEPGRAEKTGIWLVRIDTSGSIASFPLPVYSQGTDVAGQEYVLVKAPADDLERSGQAYQLLDARAELTAYILAHEFRPGARAAAQGRFDVVHDDGKGLVVRSVSGGEMDALADLGFQCRWLGATPLDLDPASARGLAAAPGWRRSPAMPRCRP